MGCHVDTVRPGNLLAKSTPRRGRTTNVAGVGDQGSASFLAPCTLTQVEGARPVNVGRVSSTLLK
jgi:hypothetical protein